MKIAHASRLTRDALKAANGITEIITNAMS